MVDIRAYWTIAYRKPTANRALRVTNWAGTWAQAFYLASAFARDNLDLAVSYVPTEQAEGDYNFNGGNFEDAGTLMTATGRRIPLRPGTVDLAWIAENVIPADIAAARYARSAHKSTGSPRIALVTTGCADPGRHGEHAEDAPCPGCEILTAHLGAGDQDWRSHNGVIPAAPVAARVGHRAILRAVLGQLGLKPRAGYTFAGSSSRKVWAEIDERYAWAAHLFSHSIHLIGRGHGVDLRVIDVWGITRVEVG